MRLVFEAMQKVTAPMREVASGSHAMAQKLRGTRDELTRLQKAQSDIDAFRDLKTQVRDTARAMDAAERKVAALAREIAATESPAKKMTRAFDAAKKEASALRDAHDRTSANLNRLRGDLGSAGISTLQLADGQRRLRADMARATGEMAEQENRLKSLAEREARMAAARDRMGGMQAMAGNMAVSGAAAVGTGIAMAAPMKAAAEQAITLESRMIDIKKVADGLTAPQLAAMEKNLRQMSLHIPIAAEGLAQIAAEGARAGVAAKDLVAFTQSAAKMATAFDIAADEAGGMMAKWQTGLGLTIPQTVELGDKVNALTNAFGGTARNVTDMITRIGPLGKVAGVAGGEMAAMAQLLDKVGVQSEIGATSIKNMMLAMTKGAAATKTQKEAFAALGLDAAEMSKRMQVDARGAILSVLDALNRLPKDQQAGLLTNLFGSESVAGIAPMLSSLGQLKTNFALVGDRARWAGSMSREFDVAMSKTENQVKTAGNALGSMQSALGAKLIPMIRLGSEKMRGMAERFSEFANRNPALVTGLAYTGAALAGLMIVFGGLAIAIAGVMAPFAMFRYALTLASVGLPVLTSVLSGAAQAVLFLGRAFLLNPIGLAITGIALGAFLIYKYWDKIVPFFQNLWAGALGIFQRAIGGIKTAFGALPAWMRTIGSNMMNGLLTFIRPGALVARLLDVARAGVTAFKNFFGIRSPSRVFMAMGGHMMDGLSLGIRAGEGGPLKRLSTLSDKMTRAVATGGIAAGLASAPPALAAPRGGDTISITINAGSSASAQDIAREVERVLRERDADRAAARRGSYEDRWS